MRSHRPEGGSARDRNPHGTRPLRGLGSPQATRARSRQGRALSPAPASTAWSTECRAFPKVGYRIRNPGSGIPRQAARGITRRWAGIGRVARMPGKPPETRAVLPIVAAPPAPCGQRTAASAASRMRARRSRAPWRPLTRLRRRSADLVPLVPHGAALVHKADPGRLRPGSSAIPPRNGAESGLESCWRRELVDQGTLGGAGAACARARPGSFPYSSPAT